MKRYLFSKTLLCACLFAALPAGAADLKSVIEQTLQDHPRVLAAIDDRQSRVHEVRQAKAGYYPTLDASAGYGHEWTESPATGGSRVDLNRREAALSFRQMLFDSYATPSEVARHTARVNSAAHSLLGIVENTALSTTDVYLELLKQRQLLALAESNLKTHQRIHDQIRLRADSGVANRADLSQIEGRLALAESNLIAAQNNVREAEANYQLITGKTSGELERPGDISGAIPGSFASALQQAFDAHPVLASANDDIAAAKAQHDAARHNLYPRIHFEVDKTWNNNIDGIRGDNEDLTAMIRLRWNLYNGGKDKARRKQTAVEIEQAKAIRNHTHRQVEQTLRLAWVAYQSTQRQREFLVKHRDAVTQARDVYTRQFNVGKRTLLDLLDTENEVFEAERAFLDADYANLYAQYRILNAMGGLLQQLHISAPEATASYRG